MIPKLKVLQCVGGDTDNSRGGSITIPVHPGNDHIALLQSALPDSIYIQWELNSSYQAQFTAYDDGSEAFNLLQVQNMVQIDDQWFVIKQIQPDYSGGITTVSVTLSHVSNEVSRMRWYSSTSSPIDWGNYGHFGNNESTSLDVPSDDNSDNTTQEVTPIDLLDTALKGNSWGVTYQVIGNFDKKSIDNPFASGSVKEFITRILDAWPDAVFYPDNLNLRIYSHDEFFKDYGNRIDYIHNTSEIQLQYDTTNMVNGARLVGATYSQESQVDTGLPTGAIGKGASGVIADAKKYLGVPYVWGGAGGARGGNPYSGMDCSSFVSQVYKDFGINIPAYTVSMEAYGHEISRSQVQTGDMGFYGSHGGSYHICMALDNNTMIYEPAPGQSCKTQSIDSYPPTWWERNDQMAAIVGSATGGNDGTDATTTASKDMYYFAPFWFQDDDSVNYWGSFGGDDITSDTIQDKEAMKKYALTQFKLNPDLEIDVTLSEKQKPIAGELVRVEVRPAHYVTTTGVVAYQYYPYSDQAQNTETLNSNSKTILDYQAAQTNNANNVRQEIKNYMNSSSYSNTGQETWTERQANQFDYAERN